MERATKGPVVCIGTAIVDCTVRCAREDAPGGGGYTAEQTALSPGGEAVNQSAALAGLGVPARLVCFAGRDAAGELLLSCLEKLPVDLRYVVRPEDMATPVSVLFLDEKGDRRSVTSPAHLRNFHPERDLSFLEGAGALVLASLFRAPFDDPEIVKKIVSEADRRGIPVYADTKLPKKRDLDPESFREALSGLECIFPNEKEGAWLTGKTEPEEMAEVILQWGVKSAVIKLGERGCCYRSGKETIRLEGIPVPAADATGAGDHFIAGFLALRGQGAEAGKALRFANVCGALSTLSAGGTGTCLSFEEAEKTAAAVYGG